MQPVVEVLQPGSPPFHLLLTARLVLGRECRGVLLADEQVSRRHLELRPTDGEIVCTDLGSTNGTFLDGVAITGPTPLPIGATLVVGETRITRYETPNVVAGRSGRTTLVRPNADRVGESDGRRTSIDLVVDLVARDNPVPDTDAGTLTILFSDIESSTERLFELGDAAWFDILEHHNRVFREELRKVGGREVKSQGDGFMLTFPSVRKGLAFATAVQRRLRRHSALDPDRAVVVRMGLHTGEAITDASGDLFGRHINKAARIANLAVGGQILVSDVVREIASGTDDVEIAEVALVELRGLDGSHAVHEVRWQQDE